MKKISIIIIFVIGVFSFLAPIDFLLNFAHDDSFFYLNTAKNFAQGLGSTFAEINNIYLKVLTKHFASSY